MPRFSRSHWLFLTVLLLLLVGPTTAKASLDDCASSGISTAKRRALLVGIGAYNPAVERTFGGLTYPANDIARMKELLESPRHGFKVCTLRDSEATRDNILQALEQYLVKGLNEGDVCFFYYSGHGSWVKNSKTDENDERDETIVPYDVVRPVRTRAELKDIRDKELAEIFNRAVDSKAIVTAILDYCHSGSGLRKFATSKEIEGTDFDLELPPTDAQRKKPEENGALVISASQDFQLASGDDYSIGPLRDSYSHLTAALLLALYSTSADLISAQDLFSRVRARLEADGRSQDPIFAGNPERMRQTIFGGPTSATGHTRVGVTRELGTGRLLLLGGLADGLTDKSELARIDPATGKETVPAVNVRIVKAGLNKSTVEVISPRRNRPSPPIDINDIFEQRTWAALSEPNLTLWVPRANLSESELNRVGAEIAELRRSNRIELVQDPTTVTATHIVTLAENSSGAGWVLRDPSGLAESITPGLTAAAVLALLEQRNVQNAKLFVNVPPTDSLRRQIQLAARNRSAVAIVDNSKGAQYELVGRARMEGARVTLEYAWMLPAVLQGDRADESTAMPSATCWTGRKTTTCPPAVNDLESLALRLSKIRGWLKLTSPLVAGSRDFPYRLELRKVGTNTRATSTLVTGDRYNLLLVSDDPQPRNIFKSAFYVYILNLDASGRSTVQYPPRLSSSGLISKTEEFLVGRLPREIPLTSSRRDQIEIFDETDVRQGVLGAEHFILLVTDEPLPNLDALQFDGVRPLQKLNELKGARSLNPLEELLLEIGHDSQSRVVSTLDNWIVDHQTFKSIARPPR
jgi:hypothetical protein